MNTFVPLILSKSEELAQSDPSGLFVSLVSILVVFVALIILYMTYTLIGKIVVKTEGVNSRQKKDAIIPEETAAAIALALRNYMKDDVHDKESYRITIRRKEK